MYKDLKWRFKYKLRFNVFCFFASNRFPFIYWKGSSQWLGDENAPLRGFSWRRGSKRDTIGIWLWSEPYLVKDGEVRHYARPLSLPQPWKSQLSHCITRGSWIIRVLVIAHYKINWRGAFGIRDIDIVYYTIHVNGIDKLAGC